MPQADRLDPEEFQAIVARVHKTSPPTMSQDDFERAVLDAAENDANAKAASVRPAAADPKFDTAGVVRGVGKQLYNTGAGVVNAFMHPIDTATGLVKNQLAQFPKGVAEARAGHPSEAFGRFLAGATPLVGPAAADVGERLAQTGDVGQAVGEGATLAALSSPSVSGRVLSAGGRGAQTIGRAIARPAAWEGLGLSVAGHPLIGGGLMVAPSVLKGAGRGAEVLGDSMQALARKASPTVGETIDTLRTPATPAPAPGMPRPVARPNVGRPLTTADNNWMPQPARTWPGPVMEGEIIPQGTISGRPPMRALPERTPETASGRFGGETGTDFVRGQPIASRPSASMQALEQQISSAPPEFQHHVPLYSRMRDLHPDAVTRADAGAVVASAPEGLSEFQRIEPATQAAPTLRGGRSADTGFNPADVDVMREMIHKGYDAKTMARISHVPAASIDALMRAAMPSRSVVLNVPVKP